MNSKAWWGALALGLTLLWGGCKPLQVERHVASAWFHDLPACPCENPDRVAVQLDDGWAQDLGEIETYHPGAEMCFRSYPPVRTQAGWSAQQCCYDAEGYLIQAGVGAGTPDQVSTCLGEDQEGQMEFRWWALGGHYFKDVRPWQKEGGPAGWQSYQRYWPPDHGCSCNE